MINITHFVNNEFFLLQNYRWFIHKFRTREMSIRVISRALARENSRIDISWVRQMINQSRNIDIRNTPNILKFRSSSKKINSYYKYLKLLLSWLIYLSLNIDTTLLSFKNWWQIEVKLLKPNITVIYIYCLRKPIDF